MLQSQRLEDIKSSETNNSANKVNQISLWAKKNIINNNGVKDNNVWYY